MVFTTHTQYTDKTTTLKANNIKTHSQPSQSTQNFKRCLKEKQQQV